MHTNTIIPVFISTEHKQPKCPACHKDEDIVSVCKHCGHEYEDGGLTFGWKGFLVFLLAFAVFVWVVWTVGYWLDEGTRWNGPSLVDVVVSQYEWVADNVSNLRVW